MLGRILLDCPIVLLFVGVLVAPIRESRDRTHDKARLWASAVCYGLAAVLMVISQAGNGLDLITQIEAWDASGRETLRELLFELAAGSMFVGAVLSLSGLLSKDRSNDKAIRLICIVCDLLGVVLIVIGQLVR